MADSTPTYHTRKIFLFGHPRTRTHLFVRLLQTHPQITSMKYPFVMALMRGPESQWPDNITEGLNKAAGKTKGEAAKEYENCTYQAGLDNMEKEFAQAKIEDKICLIKEHTSTVLQSKIVNSYCKSARKETRQPTTLVDHKLDVINPDIEAELERDSLHFPLPNPTFLPDRLLATVSPVITIRHPMYSFPSWVRAASTFGSTVFDTEFAVTGSFRWQRIIYDFYRAYYDSLNTDQGGDNKKDWPIVIDGDKLVDNTQGQMSKFCALVGLPESGIRYTWESTDQPTDHVTDAFLGTIMGSKGVIKRPDYTRAPDLDEEVREWSAEWNEEVAQKIREAVISAQEDYEYLRARCL